MEEKELLFQEVDGLSDRLTALADDIFDHPEPGLKEERASGQLVELFREEGFQVETGIAGLPTAFRAVYEQGSGGPSIGLLCEYDALEHVGHACGHHIQGPAIFGAAGALQPGGPSQP